MTNFQKIILLTFSFGLTLFACNETPRTTPPAAETKVEKPRKAAPNALVADLENAQMTAKVQDHDVVSFDLILNFGGSERFNGTITTRTDSGKIKMTRRSDGTTVIYDGNELRTVPDTAEWKNARFAIFTWQYFFMAPYKLNDPGTQWEMTGEKFINGTDYDTGKLTFAADTGDAPDDWYLVYKNKENNLLEGMAYIVTFGDKDIEKAEENAHAIYYRNFQKVRGDIPVASEWEFFNWNEEEGFNGDPIGNARISNVVFSEEKEGMF